MFLPSATPPAAGRVPGLLRRALRVVAAAAAVLRVGSRRIGRSTPVRAPEPVRRVVAAARRAGAGPRRAALPLDVVVELGPRRLGLSYGCVAWSSVWPHRLGLALSRQAVQYGVSLHPAVWAGAVEMPSAEAWQESSFWHRCLLEDIERNDAERPLRALRQRLRRRALRLVIDPATPAGTVRAMLRSWPPALASPLLT